MFTSPLSLLLVLGEVVVATNAEDPNDIRWNPFTNLNALDSAGELCLFAHNFEHKQENRILSLKLLQHTTHRPFGVLQP